MTFRSEKLRLESRIYALAWPEMTDGRHFLGSTVSGSEPTDTKSLTLSLYHYVLASASHALGFLTFASPSPHNRPHVDCEAPSAAAKHTQPPHHVLHKSFTIMSPSSQCAGSTTPSLAAVAFHNHVLARSYLLAGTAAHDDTASSLAISPNFSAAPLPGSLRPDLHVSQQPQQQLRRPSENAEKLQKFLSILHEAIDLINEDDDDVSSWL
jgi:hypothetical protein